MANHLKQKPPCENCGGPTSRVCRQFCSIKCQHEKARKIRFQGGPGGMSQRQLRAYLLYTRPYRCEVCLRRTWQGQPIPLDADHIDGDASNNQEGNLRLICLNCHGQTTTWKARNRGKGREVRRQSIALEA